METTDVDPFEGLEDEDRERLLAGFAGEGPDLAVLLVELAGVARGEGRTRLAEKLYNSALYQEDARGRPGSEIALACTKAIAEIELKIGDPLMARVWGRRLQRLARDDRTAKAADRIVERASKAIPFHPDAERRRQAGSPTRTPVQRTQTRHRAGSVEAGEDPSIGDPRSGPGLVESMLLGGEELSALLLDAAERALKSDDKTAALQWAGMAHTAELGRGAPASRLSMRSVRILVRIHLERDNPWAAHNLVNELLQAPDVEANREGERLMRRLMKKRNAISAGSIPMVGNSQLFTPEPLRPELTFADVGGMIEPKETIRRYGILPAQNPELAKRFRIESGGALLLSGPPGCGKTLLAQAAAGEMGVAMYVVAVTDILHPLLGMSERNLANAFKVARDTAPCVLFFDELDALSHNRSNPMMWAGYRDVTNTSLAEMDGVRKNAGVLVMGATNVPDLVDPALLRAGRFSRQIHVGTPDAAARDAIWRIVLDARPLSEGIDIPLLVELSRGTTGAQITQAAHEAAEAVWVQCVEDSDERSIAMIDLLVALRRFVDGKAKRRVDELIDTSWQDAVGR